MRFYSGKIANLISVQVKSLSEAFILTSTNPKYDKRLLVDLQVQYMKTTNSENVVLNVKKTKTKKILWAT